MQSTPLIKRGLADHNSGEFTSLAKTNCNTRGEIANESSKSKYPDQFGPNGCENSKLVVAVNRNIIRKNTF